MAARLASEELVKELASGRISSFEISENQRAFKMPPYLVYLVGVLIAEEVLYQRKNSVRTIRDERFADFQKQYLASSVRSRDDRRSNSNNSDKETNTLLVEPSPKIFILTAGLHPTKELQAIVNQDLLKKIPVTKISPENDEEEPVSNNKTSPKTTEEVMAMKIQNSIVDSTSTVEEDKSWVEIKKNNCDSSRIKGGSTATINLDCGENKEEVDDMKYSSNSIKTTRSISVTREQTPILHAKENIMINNDDRATSTTDLLPDSQDEKDSSSINKNHPCTENTYSVMKNSNKLPTGSNSSSDNEFRKMNSIELETHDDERVAVLEQNLIDLEQKLTKERIAHTNLIQGLQLRLYISETKLRTYEDALQNHIQAVSTLSCSISTKKISDEELIPSSPSLLSKIIETKSNNNIDDSHLGVNF
ncbi:hypothetical protein FRACYDRAFT_235438 [Fragilariopsis cylindrus CCMP1102]|uniref:Uncharacterized protein n=1 Tax=Fragilariopsis cylindrus CCMP1102 TaxID=635003 RepID=A0A1E7FMN0_9STRA|nr:hypothetical protein FRACYDRAFT_235438 [Fragilariopsis cylindrus CCMP1102]|eukprot:OEU19384.1 hypothetical protein FRACYDRAFT_235438 [Fragilariopsis cylindrus CCMP1102]